MVHKTYIFFQTAPHTYRTKYELNKLKNHGSQSVKLFFQTVNFSDIQVENIRLILRVFLVRLRVQFFRYRSRIFPIYISDKLWSE